MVQLPEANKSLGQHFLIDKSVITKITDDFKEVAKAIVEVGPGPGILTENLSAHKLPLHVIDKDERFPEYLKQFIEEDKIHITDALKWDLEQGFIDWGYSKDIWMVSNLPYNVSTPLLIQFIKAPSIKYMTLMFQREVADKVFPIDTREGKAMNSLLALCQTFFEVELLCKVPPGAFAPPPKVDSAVLSFTRREETIISLDQFKSFESFLRSLFQFKRKQMGSNLKSRYPKETLESALSACGLERTQRAESLKLEEIQQLYLELEMKK